MTTKYYAGKIDERNGDYEYNTTYYFQLTGRKSPIVALERIASEWYGNNNGKDGNAYWFNGEVLVSAGNVIEIPEETYNIMRAL